MSMSDLAAHLTQTMALETPSSDSNKKHKFKKKKHHFSLNARKKRKKNSKTKGREHSESISSFTESKSHTRYTVSIRNHHSVSTKNKMNGQLRYGGVALPKRTSLTDRSGKSDLQFEGFGSNVDSLANHIKRTTENGSSGTNGIVGVFVKQETVDAVCAFWELSFFFF